MTAALAQTTDVFRTQFAQQIFNYKYKHSGCETWEELSKQLVQEVCEGFLPQSTINEIAQLIIQRKFIPGGRYLYYAGRSNKFYNNCYLLKSEEDSREDWANLSWKAESCLTTGGGIGNDYSIYRPSGSPIARTGGSASGPISKMQMINEIGRQVMQGGSRRSAIYASLNWRHDDIYKFLYIKDWYNQQIPGTNISLGQVKELDFNYPATLDHTNISANYDNAFLTEVFELPLEAIQKAVSEFRLLEVKKLPRVFLENCRQAMMTGEPGFSFNFFDKENETLRNACTEVTSEDDSDVCNLGSMNMAAFDNLQEFAQACDLASQFLLCGTLRAHLPYDKVYKVREKNRRLGLGLMGIHEWLLKRGERYQVTAELETWLAAYQVNSESAKHLADDLSISRPVAYRAIAPTGTISILAETTSGIEPVVYTAYKRRYLADGLWRYQYVIDSVVHHLVDTYGIDPNTVESSSDLATDYKRRIEFQAKMQRYVDMSISSTINLPKWGSEHNNEDKVVEFATTLAQYAPYLRGFTCYPDQARGGQPLNAVPYQEAVLHMGKEFVEEQGDMCTVSGKGGFCGA